MYLHRVGDKVPPISKGAEDEQRRQVEPVVRVVQFRAPLRNLSDCDAAPYLRFFLVRNEEVVGSNPISSTRFKKRNLHHLRKRPILKINLGDKPP